MGPAIKKLIKLSVDFLAKSYILYNYIYYKNEDACTRYIQ